METELKSSTTRTESHTFEFPPLIDAGTYAATFVGAHEVAFTDKITHEPGELLVWAFTLDSEGEGDDEPPIVEGVSSLLLTARSKGFAWLRAIAPDIVAKRTDVNASGLVGRPCFVVVESNAETGEVKVADVMPPINRK